MQMITNPRICDIKTKTVRGKIKYWCQFTYYVNGVRKNGKSNTCDTPTEAKENAQLKIDRIIGEVKINDTSKYTVEDVAKHYINEMLNKKRKIEETTRESNISKVRSLVMCEGTKAVYTTSTIRNKQINKLTDSDINGWLKRIYKFYEDEEIGDVTYHKMKRAMFILLEHANMIDCFDSYKKYKELIDVIDDCKHTVSKKKSAINRAKRIVNDAQFLKLLDDGKYFKNGQYPMPDEYDKLAKKYKMNFIMDCRYYMLFSVLFYTGMRMSEARPLRMSDVRFEEVNGYDAVKISITKSKSGKCAKGRRKEYRNAPATEPKTKSAIRTVHVFGPFVTAFDNYYTELEAYYEEKGIEDGLLFPSKTNGEMSDHAVDEKLKRWHRRIEDEVEKFTKHDFRRSRVTIMLKNGRTISEIIAYIGHKEEKIIQDYYDARNAEDRFRVMSKVIDSTDFSADYHMKVALSEFETKKNSTSI